MVTGLAPAALSQAYELELDLLRGRAGVLVAAAFARAGDRELTDAQWAELIAALYLAWVGTQLGAVTAAENTAAATVLTAGGNPGPRPLLNETYVGRTRSGGDVYDVLAATRRVVGARIAGGTTAAEALAASSAYLSFVVGSDPHRLARDATLDLAQGPSQKIIGWQRIAEPGACKFCRQLATRGAVYTSEATASRTAAGGKYHWHCRCRVEGVADQVSRQRTIKAGREQWQQMVRDGDIPKPGRRAQESALTGTRYEAASAESVARHNRLQLEQLQASIPALQQRVAAGDTAAVTPLAWQQGRVEQLLRTLGSAAAA